MPRIILFIQFFTFIANLLMGLFVLSKRPKSVTSWFFWILTVGVAGWNLSLFEAISGFGQSLLWGRLAFSFGALMPLGLYLFSLVFPRKAKFFLLRVILIVSLSAIFFTLSLSDLLIKSVIIVDRTYISGELSPLYFLYLLYYFGFLIAAFCKLLHTHYHSTGIQRVQLKYVSSGIILFFIPLFITQLILPIFGIFKYNNLGPLFTIVMIIMVAYAITRYRFLDIRVIIQRSLLYSILVILITAIYIGLGEAAKNLLTDRQAGSFLSSILTSSILILSYPHFKEFFNRWTDHIFFKEHYDYLEVLGGLSKALISKIDRVSLLKEVEEILRRNLKISFLKFLSVNKPNQGDGRYNKILDLLNSRILKNQIIICEELDYIKKNNSEKNKIYLELRKITKELGIGGTMPIFYQDAFKGIFLLGEKLSHDLFNKQDIKLLTILSRHIGVALNNAELYEELKNSNINLESKVQERTQELKRLFEAQSKFLADISHELKTPLAIVKGNAAMLSKEVETDSHKKALELIDQTLDNMSVLLNNILALARVDFGEKINKKPMVLNNLLEEVYDSFGPIASDKNINLSLESPDESFLIEAECRLIKELFLNLLSNAIKFTGSGGKITIKLEADANEVRVSIEDTGIGIPEKDLPFIFERFYQVQNGEFKKGIGLGLAICKKIVDIHGGTISAASKVGEGSKFTVVFSRIFA